MTNQMVLFFQRQVGGPVDIRVAQMDDFTLPQRAKAVTVCTAQRSEPKCVYNSQHYGHDVKKRTLSWHHLPGGAPPFATQNPGFMMHCCSCVTTNV